MATTESKKRSVNLAWLAGALLAVVLVASAFAQDEPIVEEPLPDEELQMLLEEAQMPGTIEGTGTYFEVTDSEYLNIALASSEPVHLTVESVPQMVVIHIEAAEGATAAQITLGGFAPSTTYYKYQDDYHNEEALTTDADGSYTFAQDLTIPHLVLIQPQAGTIYLSDSGWSKPVGTWDLVTKTGTLTTDVYETIQVNSNDITLNGNGHVVTGTGSGYGLYLPSRTGVTIHDLTVQGFYYGIYLYNASYNTLTDNTTTDNADGIRLYWYCSNNALTGNIASQNTCGIYLDLSGKNTLTGNTASQNTYGIWLDGFCNSNTLTSNIVDLNTYYGIYLNYYSSYNTLTRNAINSTIWYGIWLRAFSNNNTLTGNTCSNNKHGIYLYHHCSNNTLKGNTVSNNAWGTYCIYSSNNNRFYNNNFISNSKQAYVYASSGNLFNLEKPVGGNYWSDYTGEDTDGDGIGDTEIPYTFTGGQDYLPWVVQNGWAPIWIEQLVYQVEALNLQKGIDNSLDAKLEAAAKALDDINENNDVAAINTLQAFINAVEAQRGNKILEADADALIAAAQAIIAMLSGV